jgi:hypothetical protein
MSKHSIDEKKFAEKIKELRTRISFLRRNCIDMVEYMFHGDEVDYNNGYLLSEELVEELKEELLFKAYRDEIYPDLVKLNSHIKETGPPDHWDKRFSNFYPVFSDI